MPFAHSKTRVALELAVLVGLLVAVVWAIVAGGRWVAERAAAALPRSVDAQIGEVAARAYAAEMPPCPDARTVAAVEALVARLRAAAGDEAGPLTVKVSARPDVNAFALPGGHIYVLAGLLRKIESADELAGVLSHEIGHVVRRHHIRKLGRSLGVGIALQALFGNADALSGALAGAAERLTELAFSRAEEADADEYGARLAHKAGFDPAALGPFLARLGGPALPGFLQDHPAGADRERALSAIAAQLGRPATPPAAPPIPLADLKRACDTAP